MKLRPPDYNAIPNSNRFMHINAIPCDHAARRKYAIVPIVGWALNEPVVDIKKPLVVFCERVSILPALGAVTLDAMPKIIGRPRSAVELCRIMFDRYGALRGWQADEVRSKPVLLSEFLRV